MSKRKMNGISAKGYYIALILCAVAIGVSGYLYYRHANNQDPASAQNDPSLSADATEHQDVEAVATEPANTPTSPSQTIQPTQPAQRKFKTAAPVAGQTVMAYAMDCLSYNQTTRDWRVHDGVDIAAEAGTAVCAAADGQVYTVYEDDTMGTTVVIRHAGGYVTKYASLAADVPVSAGSQVTMGQTIGYVGNSALLESAIGDHLHFSVSCDGESIDPEGFLDLE